MTSGLKCYLVYVDGALNYTGTDTSWATDSLADGAHTWHVVARDNAHLERASNQTWLFTTSAALSVQLTSFTAAAQPYDKQVTVLWTTASETNSYRWIVERSVMPENGYMEIGSLPASGSHNGTRQYRYVDHAGMTGTEY